MKKRPNKENHFIFKNFIILGFFLGVCFCPSSIKAMEKTIEESTDKRRMTIQKLESFISSDFFTEELKEKMRNITLKSNSENNTESKENLLNPREIEIILYLKKSRDGKQSLAITHHQEIRTFILHSFPTFTDLWKKAIKHNCVKKDALRRLVNCCAMHTQEPHILWNEQFSGNKSGKYHQVPWNNCPLCVWSCVLTSKDVEGYYNENKMPSNEKEFALQVAALFEEQINSIHLSHDEASKQLTDVWEVDQDDHKIIREKKGNHAIWIKNFDSPSELIPNVRITWKDCSTCQKQGIYMCENFLNTMLMVKLKKNGF